MKRIFWLAVIFLLIKPQAVSLSFDQAQSPLSTFPNGGFETNPTDPNNGWSWPTQDWVWDGNVAHSGTYSARVYRGGGDATASIYSAYISVQPSTIYTLTYWIRTQDATYFPSVNLYQYISQGNQTGPRMIMHANIFPGLGDWQLVSYRFQTTTDAHLIRFGFTYLTPRALFGLMTSVSIKVPLRSILIIQASRWMLPARIFSSPVVADINKDGANELLIASGDAVFGWNHDGVLLPNFPLLTGDERIQGNLAVADLDGDGGLEIVAGTKTPVLDGQGRVFIWHSNGTY